jgi:hypothetical protein
VGAGLQNELCGMCQFLLTVPPLKQSGATARQSMRAVLHLSVVLHTCPQPVPAPKTKKANSVELA